MKPEHPTSSVWPAWPPVCVTFSNGGTAQIRAHEQQLTQRLLDGLAGNAGVRIIGTQDANQQVAVISFILEGQPVSETAHTLDEQFGIMCRPGLHCAPRAHQTLATSPNGTVRFSPGLFNTETEIEQALEAVTRLTRVQSHE